MPHTDHQGRDTDQRHAPPPSTRMPRTGHGTRGTGARHTPSPTTRMPCTDHQGRDTDQRRTPSPTTRMPCIGHRTHGTGARCTRSPSTRMPCIGHGTHGTGARYTRSSRPAPMVRVHDVCGHRVRYRVLRARCTWSSCTMYAVIAAGAACIGHDAHGPRARCMRSSRPVLRASGTRTMVLLHHIRGHHVRCPAQRAR
jgi:hypothetical protein